MNEKSRRTRFEERVRIERDFLVPINQCFGSLAPLAGMTGAAITSWQTRVMSVTTEVDIVRVAFLLREAAARAELLADNSRDVFESAELTNSDGLNSIKTMLVKELQAGFRT